jgi:hypothetical protein
MKKVLISESDLNRLVKKIINESSIPGALTQILRNLDPVIQSRTVQRLKSLLTNDEIDNFIYVNGKQRSVTNGSQVLDNFINGRLTSKDSEDVFNVIFKTTEDPKDMQVMADFLMGEKEFFLKYKGKTKEQLMSELTPIYGQKQAQILSDKITYKNLPKVVWKTFWEMNSEAWASPKLWQSISKIITSKGDKAAWTALVRWFFTGTTRNVKKTFKDYLKLYESFGFSKPSIWALARLTSSIGLEALQRWAYASSVTTVIKMVVEFVRLQGTSTAEEKLTQNWADIIGDSLIRNWSIWDHNWFIPATAVVPAAIRFLEGLSRSMSWEQIYEYVINGNYPLHRDLISLENGIETKIPFNFG